MLESENTNVQFGIRKMKTLHHEADNGETFEKVAGSGALTDFGSNWTDGALTT